MTIALHRFALSHFSEKTRACLDFKGLDYRVVEHTQGADQLALWRLSGQRKVPVIEHDGSVVHDSTAIALYLDHAFTDGHRALLPSDLRARREVLELEDRLDAMLGPNVPVIAFDHAQRDPAVRDATLRVLIPGSALARGAASVAGTLSRPALWLPAARARVDGAYAQVREILGECCDRLASRRYLTGDTPTLADVTAAGLSFNLRYPRSAYLAAPDLAGVGVPDLINDPTLARFFQWRDALYAAFLK
jgi:glutathione S-transferase